jgi:hypothetical protein
MAVDGPYDGDAASDAFRPPDRIGHERVERMVAGLELADPERLDREECYQELRAHDTADLRPGVSATGDVPERTDAGGWKWKGLELDPEANAVADQAIEARRKAEGRDAEGNYPEAGITPDMRRIEAELEHGTLVPDTERFALKSPDRFKEKLAKLITLEADSSPADLAAQIHDGIRYTFMFDGGHYSRGVRQVEDHLTADGYELVGRKPSWSGAEYRGINSQWRDMRSGQLFEVQFHTPESWHAKQCTHDSYEKIECPATLPEERVRLRAFQREIVAKVCIPPGALDFLPYRKVRDESGG